MQTKAKETTVLKISHIEYLVLIRVQKQQITNCTYKYKYIL